MVRQSARMLENTEAEIMSLKNAKAFLEKSNADSALKGELEKLKNEAAVKLGKESGFDFTAEELIAAQEELGGDLDDDLLAGQSGGLGGIEQTVPDKP
jgi:predicted ribosomally synthesized peptide with nif11-like leader